jgi:hypothetical protein
MHMLFCMDPIDITALHGRINEWLNRKPSTAQEQSSSWSETKRKAHLVPVSLRAALHNQQQDQASR